MRSPPPYLLYHFHFYFGVQKIYFIHDYRCVIIFPLNCKSINVQGNFTNKVNFHYSCYFPDLEYM